VCDFEQALQSAVETELQYTRICSCSLIVLLGRKYKNFPIIILVTKEIFAVPSSLPFSLKYYIIDIVRNVGQQSTSGST
jgi:hypothetical protein